MIKSCMFFVTSCSSVVTSCGTIVISCLSVVTSIDCKLLETVYVLQHPKWGKLLLVWVLLISERVLFLHFDTTPLNLEFSDRVRLHSSRHNRTLFKPICKAFSKELWLLKFGRMLSLVINMSFPNVKFRPNPHRTLLTGDWPVLIESYCWI